MPFDKWLREHRFAVIAAAEEDGSLEAIRATVEYRPRQHQREHDIRLALAILKSNKQIAARFLDPTDHILMQPNAADNVNEMNPKIAARFQHPVRPQMQPNANDDRLCRTEPTSIHHPGNSNHDGVAIDPKALLPSDENEELLLVDTSGVRNEEPVDAGDVHVGSHSLLTRASTNKRPGDQMDGDGGTATKTARITAGGAGAGGSIATDSTTSPSSSSSSSSDSFNADDVPDDEAQNFVIEAEDAASEAYNVAFASFEKVAADIVKLVKKELEALEADNAKLTRKLEASEADNAALMKKLAALETDKADLEKRNKRLVEASKKLFSAAMAEAG